MEAFPVSNELLLDGRKIQLHLSQIQTDLIWEPQEYHKLSHIIVYYT